MNYLDSINEKDKKTQEKLKQESLNKIRINISFALNCDDECIRLRLLSDIFCKINNYNVENLVVTDNFNYSKEMQLAFLAANKEENKNE